MGTNETPRRRRRVRPATPDGPDPAPDSPSPRRPSAATTPTPDSDRPSPGRDASGFGHSGRDAAGSGSAGRDAAGFGRGARDAAAPGRPDSSPPRAASAGTDEPQAAVAETTPVHDEPPPVIFTAALPTEADGAASERGLRGLVGPGSSQVRPAAALRARDAARPRPADIARAESDLTIIRRNWSPRD